MRLQFFIPTVIASGVAWAALALETPRSSSQDGRIRFVDYQPYNITKVVGTLRSSVQIEFSADEEIAHVALGNSVAWEVAPAGNILFLKPRESQPVTNISVVTARRDGSTRSYQMELTVRDGSVALGQNTYFYVKYRYPTDEAQRRRLDVAARAQTAQPGLRIRFLLFTKPTDRAIGGIRRKARKRSSRIRFTTTAKLRPSPLPAIRKCLRSTSKTRTEAKVWFRSRSMATSCWFMH